MTNGKRDKSRSGRGRAAQRRALAQRGLPTLSKGDAATVDILERAWREADKEADTLTHGFHTYPARMHPAIARECLALHDGVVLDPFCGSGTVLVEAMVAGRQSIGVDLNPLAVRIAEAKSAVLQNDELDAFEAALEDIAERSEERVRARQPVRAELSREEARWYQGHTLKELAGLLEELRKEPDTRRRKLLEMVFSAIVVKFSLQRADTAQRQVDKRIRKGLPTEFFVRRGQELVERWRALNEALPSAPKAPRVRVGDASKLPKLLTRKDTLERVDLIITSPPYGGTYDYVDHHARRYPWLGIDPTPFAQGEIGARRRSQSKGAKKRWDRELGDVLRSMSSVMNPGAIAVLLIGDGHLDGEAVPADEQLKRLAPGADLELRAVASQPRPDWREGANAPRAEHLIVLQRA